MKYGCFGKILFVDLLKEQFEERSVPEEFYQQYLGGYGLAVRLLYELTPPKLDPLHPDIPIGLFPGLMTGTPAPFSGRYISLSLIVFLSNSFWFITRRYRQSHREFSLVPRKVSLIPHRKRYILQ